MADAASLTKLVSRDMLMRPVGRALRAPSVHNSQPWQWRISDGVVELTRTRTGTWSGPIPTGGTW